MALRICVKYHSGCDDEMVRYGIGALNAPHLVQSVCRPSALEMEFEPSRDGLHEHLKGI